MSGNVTVPVRAVIYCRISQDDGRALGVRRQEADCRGHCETRGWTVSDVLVDNDQSAYTGKRRPGYETLLDGLRSGRWDVLVAWHPDRLHRRPAELEDFIDVVEASGTAVSTVTAGEYDLSTPEGRLVARITGAVARKESEDKSRRSRRKQAEIAASGGVSGGGLRPFGYEADKVTVIDAEAVLIRDAVTRVLGGASVRSVVTDWRGRLPPPRGGVWTNTSVKRVLTSPRIAGLRVHHGEVVGPAIWPAIIDPDDLFRVRALLTETRVPTARSYLLAGFLRCGECDRPMVSHPVHHRGKIYRNYRCSRDRGGCGGTKIAAQATEDTVRDGVVEWLDRRPPPKREPVLPDVTAVDAQEAELATAYGDGLINMAEWRVAREALERRRERLLAEGADAARRSLEASLVGPGARARWESASFDGRRSMIALSVERIVILPASVRGGRFDPDRVDITFREV